MAWQNDKLFRASDPDSLSELGGIASPAFRVSAQGTLKDAHPFDHVEAYDRLFNVFKPLLQRHAERLTFNERGGAKSRRRTSITRNDWQPFHYMKNVIEADDRYFIGFDFKSEKAAKLLGKGPTGFRFRVARTVQIDATISVADFAQGLLDLDALKEVILQLPMRSVIAGFGMATSAYFDGHDEALALLIPVARKFPALDVCPSPLRAWFSDYDENFNASWIAGVNWLTLVGEPYLSALGGADAVLQGLPKTIEAYRSRQAVLLQLGDRPITGQCGVDDALLPLYHALGRKLQPIGEGCPSARHPRYPVFNSDHVGLSLKWERRFFDGCWFEKTEV